MAPRIAHVISTRGVGGAERFLGDLIRAGAERGWEQLVLNPFDDPSAHSSLVELFSPAPYLGFSCTAPTSLLSARRWMKLQVANFKPDIVHALLFHALVGVATMPRGDGEGRLLTHVYGEGIRIGPRPAVRERLDRWAGRRFDHVIGISRSVEAFLTSQYRYPSEKVSCIYLGWEGEPLPPVADDSTPTIVCVANLRPEKGHTVLLDAFGLVRQEFPRARLLLVGGGKLHEELASRVAAAGLADSVEFVGAVPDAWPSLARGHIFALPSLSEAFGIAAVEAMAAGLPVVASDVGALPELVVPGVTGELFPVGDHRALAYYLTRLLGSPEQRKAMGRAARERAAAIHRSKVLPQYLDVWDELLRRRRDSHVTGTES